MMKKIFAILALSLALFAAPATKISDFDSLHFEDAFEKKSTIPKDVKMIIVSFDRAGNSMIAEYLNAKSKGLLEKHGAIYIGDIHKMPALVTMMFARPKMKKYNFTTYLYDEEGLTNYIPYKEDMVTILHVEEGNIIKTSFSKDVDSIFKQ